MKFTSKSSLSEMYKKAKEKMRGSLKDRIENPQMPNENIPIGLGYPLVSLLARYVTGNKKIAEGVKLKHYELYLKYIEKFRDKKYFGIYDAISKGEQYKLVSGELHDRKVDELYGRDGE